MQEYMTAQTFQMIEKGKEFFSKELPNIKIKVWSEKQIIDLLATKYPDYLYRYIRILNTIQRCDLARGFILHSEGGLYMDIDYVPSKKIKTFFFDELLWTSHKIIVGNNSLLGVNNAWIYSNKGNLFWEKYLINAFSEVESPSLFNIFISIIFPTWATISSTGPIQFNKLVKLLEVDSRVFKQWGDHGIGSEPTWFNKKACTLQTLLVLISIVLSLGFLCSRSSMLC